MKIQNYIKENSGQIVLILVLITVVGLTIGLSLISRTITDVRISTQIEQSGRAFSAAEAGVESALKGAVAGGPTGTVTFPGVSASYNVANIGGEVAPLSFPLTAVGSTQTVWLADHKSDGIDLDENSTYPVGSTFTICWGTDPNKNPALLLSLYYKDTATNIYKVAKLAYDPIPGRSNFYPKDDNVNSCSNNYRYKKTLSATGIPPGDGFGISSSNTILLALRIQPVFDDTAIAIVPTASIPVQGKLITSIGQTATGVVRKIQVTQGYQVLPTLLDFALFSEN